MRFLSNDKESIKSYIFQSYIFYLERNERELKFSVIEKRVSRCNESAAIGTSHLSQDKKVDRWEREGRGGGIELSE